MTLVLVLPVSPTRKKMGMPIRRSPCLEVERRRSASRTKASISSLPAPPVSAAALEAAAAAAAFSFFRWRRNQTTSTINATSTKPRTMYSVMGVLSPPLRGNGPQLRHHGTEAEQVAHEQQQRDPGAHRRDNAPAPDPGIGLADGFLLGWWPGGREPAEASTNAADFFAREVHDLRQLAAIAGAVAAAKTEQKAEIVNLDEVGKVVGIAAAQQLLQGDEEFLAGRVGGKQLRSEQFAQPLHENGVLRIEHRFIEKGDGGEGSVARVFRRVTDGECLAGRRLECLAGVVAESVGVGHALAVGAQANNGGKYIQIGRAHV